MKPKYNILTNAECSIGYKHTKLTKMKMKLNWLRNPSRKEHIKNINLNKPLIKSTKDK